MGGGWFLSAHGRAQSGIVIRVEFKIQSGERSGTQKPTTNRILQTFAPAYG